MLGLLEGDVELIPAAPSLPHIGWNRLEVRRDHPVMAGLADGTPAYFVHSYAPVPSRPGHRRRRDRARRPLRQPRGG